MPNGDALKTGVKFIDIRSQYKDDPMFQKLEEYYNKNKSTKGFALDYHRFWHAGDYLMAVGTMATLFPEAIPANTKDDYTLDTDMPTPDGDKAHNGSDIPDDGVLYGDVNLDKNVDLSDLLKLSQYLLHDITLSSDAMKAADCNGDGEVSINDLPLLKQFVMQDKITLGPKA